MDRVLKCFTVVVTSIVATINNTLIGEHRLLVAYIVLMVLDYLTGLCSAIRQKKLSSNVGAKGIACKVITLCVIAVGYIIDTVFGWDGVVSAVVTTFYIANEVCSVVENATLAGVPVPEVITEKLEQVQRVLDTDNRK